MHTNLAQEDFKGEMCNFCSISNVWNLSENSDYLLVVAEKQPVIWGFESDQFGRQSNGAFGGVVATETSLVFLM